MTKLTLPALDPTSVPPVAGSEFPSPFRERFAGRSRRPVGNALGLTNFGVNVATLAPGAISALRHWHTAQDEFVYVLEGELTLVTDAGEQVLTPGMCAGFPKNKADGHQLRNATAKPATYLEVGDRSLPDHCTYPDDDMAVSDFMDGTMTVTHKDGRSY